MIPNMVIFLFHLATDLHISRIYGNQCGK